MSSRVLSSTICIIGAGPGGLSAAMFLAKAGIPSLVVEKAVFPRDKICGDALSGKVVQTLHRINPQLVADLQAEPFQVGSWGVIFAAPNGKQLRVPFKKQIQQSEKAPGYIAKRLHFDDFLYRAAKQNPLITIVEGEELTTFQRQGNGWLLQGETLEVTTELVLAADGAQSKFARQVAGFTLDAEHYCAGIRAYYTGVTGMDDENFIELHFLKELLPGYLWIFPLPDGGANVGLGVRSDYISKKRLNLKKMLPQLLSAYPALSERFANASLQGDVKGFGLPLGSKKRPISGNGYMLLGDAASLIDPFTGEGIGNAMICGQKAAEVIVDLKAAGKPSTALLQYDMAVYKRMWNELALSRRMQQLVQYPWLFNLVVNKAHRSPTLQETIMCMFEDLELRNRLKQPGFYLNLLLNR